MISPSLIIHPPLSWWDLERLEPKAGKGLLHRKINNKQGKKIKNSTRLVLDRLFPTGIFIINTCISNPSGRRLFVWLVNSANIDVFNQYIKNSIESLIMTRAYIWPWYPNSVIKAKQFWIYELIKIVHVKPVLLYSSLSQFIAIILFWGFLIRLNKPVNEESIKEKNTRFLHWYITWF